MRNYMNRAAKSLPLTLAGLAGATILAPRLAPIFLAAGATAVLARRRDENTYPLKKPKGSGLDANELNPATGKPMEAKGTHYLGVEDGTNKPLWMSDDDLRQHFLVLGTQGSGTESVLHGFIHNVLARGGGCLYMDPKGDLRTTGVLSALAATYGRSEDFLVLDFTPQREDSRCSESVRFNPFETLSPEAAAQAIVEGYERSYGDRMWIDRSMMMHTSVLRSLFWLRDNKGLYVDASLIRQSLGYDAIVALSERSELPETYRGELKAYLSSLPTSETLKQHDFLELQSQARLKIMIEDYPHIFLAGRSDIDLADIILNARILNVLLPGVSRNAEHSAFLGSLVTRSLKEYVGRTLGGPITSDGMTIPSHDPREGDLQFMVVIAEAGYCVVGGLSLLAAQARSLGISMVYATSDIASLRRLNSLEAECIIANTNTKIFMRTECEENQDFIRSTVEREGNRYSSAREKNKGNRDQHPDDAGKLVRSLNALDGLIINKGKVIRARLYGPYRVGEGFPFKTASPLFALDAADFMVPGKGE